MVARALVKEKHRVDAKINTGTFTNTAKLRESVYEEILSLSVALDLVED